jgi:hypothetical protein
MRRFIMYRPHPPENYVKEGYANPPEEKQLEGIIFSDGTVCVRWLTETKSHSLWDNMYDFIKVHGHPEYGTEVVFLDPITVVSKEGKKE